MSSIGTDCETSPKRINDQKCPLTHSVGTPDDSADANTVNNNSNRDITENGSAKHKISVSMGKWVYLITPLHQFIFNNVKVCYTILHSQLLHPVSQYVHSLHPLP